MVTRAGFLTTRFGGYLHREVPEEDAELSHVGPDTPCGAAKGGQEPRVEEPGKSLLPPRFGHVGQRTAVACCSQSGG
jgi:hypothetical protein